MSATSLVQVEDLKVHFPIRRGWFGRSTSWLPAVDGVNLTIAPRETLGLVGESGSGKTTLGRAVLRLLTPTAGRVIFEDTDITNLPEGSLRKMRRRMQVVFQDPYGSLDPRMTARAILEEALDIHRLASETGARRGRIKNLLEAVGLTEEHAGRYPREFSGGQRQRIGIARALAVEPQLIVCDEPVSALDVSVQAQIVNLFQDLQDLHGLSYLFIAHDLAVVEHISHRVAVMYLGRVVELGPAKAVVSTPVHPYTQALISAIPTRDPVTRAQRIVLGGEVPSPVNPPDGCPFHPRCPLAQSQCIDQLPPWREISNGHWAACHLVASGHSDRATPKSIRSAV